MHSSSITRAISCRKRARSASLHADAAVRSGHTGDPPGAFAMTSDRLAGVERKPLEVAFATGSWSAAHLTQQEAYQIVTESLAQVRFKKKTSLYN